MYGDGDAATYAVATEKDYSVDAHADAVRAVKQYICRNGRRCCRLADGRGAGGPRQGANAKEEKADVTVGGSEFFGAINAAANGRIICGGSWLRCSNCYDFTMQHYRTKERMKERGGRINFVFSPV